MLGGGFVLDHSLSTIVDEDGKSSVMTNCFLGTYAEYNMRQFTQHGEECPYVWGEGDCVSFSNNGDVVKLQGNMHSEARY